MNEEVPMGHRFSLLYMRPGSPTTDSARLRKRLSKRFEISVGEESFRTGELIERELGIKILSEGSMSYYVDWDDFQKVELRDLLDTVTLIGRRILTGNRELGAVYVREVSRIFAEEGAAYRLDEKSGVHPAIDASFQANLDFAIRGLGTLGFSAARDHIRRADDELMPSGDTREAIRAIFDAVENVFKQSFPKATSIALKSINSDLRPYVDRLYADGPEKRTALKNIDAMSDWVDSCHNYRHEPGNQDPVPPSEELAMLIVSQGIGYARWLSDLVKKAAG